MFNMIEKLYQGAVGRVLRAGLATGAAWAVAHWQGNEWYLSLSPFLQMVGKKLRDKYPGVWEWLPF